MQQLERQCEVCWLLAAFVVMSFKVRSVTCWTALALVFFTCSFVVPVRTSCGTRAQEQLVGDPESTGARVVSAMKEFVIVCPCGHG